MSESQRPPPADMLLLRERRRRLGTAHKPAGPDDDLVLEGDAFVDEHAADEHAGQERSSQESGSISLYRPLSNVALPRMPQGSAVDHGALQNAIVCSPAREGGAGKAPGWLSAVTTFALASIPRGEPALHVSLGADDIAVLGRVGTRLQGGDAVALTRAAALPSSVVGADAATVSAAAAMLAAYRRASLVHAWQAALCGNVAADTMRERDAAAIQLLPMLRALLGET